MPSESLAELRRAVKASMRLRRRGKADVYAADPHLLAELVHAERQETTSAGARARAGAEGEGAADAVTH